MNFPACEDTYEGGGPLGSAGRSEPLTLGASMGVICPGGRAKLASEAASAASRSAAAALRAAASDALKRPGGKDMPNSN